MNATQLIAPLTAVLGQQVQLFITGSSSLHQAPQSNSSPVHFVAWVLSLCGRNGCPQAKHLRPGLLDLTAWTMLAGVADFGTEANLEDNPQ